MRFIVIAAVALLLFPGCVSWDVGEGGVLGVKVSPLASLERVQKSEAAAKEYADKLAEGVIDNATAIGNTMTAISAAEAKAMRQVEQDKFDLEDIYNSELFYLVVAGGLGIEVARRKVKKSKAELPAEYDDVSEDYEEA